MKMQLYIASEIYGGSFIIRYGRYGAFPNTLGP